MMEDHDEPARGAGEADKPASEPKPKDASFEDGFKPVRVAARDAEDLKIVSALLQDAVVLAGEMAYLPAERRFAMVLNRFRWEEPAARERVRAGVHFDGVLSARTRGVDRSVKDQPLSLLEVSFSADEAEDAVGGAVRLVFAGGGEALLTVEALDAAMADIGRPWKATATPIHRGG